MTIHKILDVRSTQAVCGLEVASCEEIATPEAFRGAWAISEIHGCEGEGFCRECSKKERGES